jgi:multidrug resistance efflux pump
MRKQTLQISLPNWNSFFSLKFLSALLILGLGAGVVYWFQAIRPYYQVTGTVYAPTREIRAEEVGTLGSAALNVGDYFHKGDLLFSIDGFTKVDFQWQLNQKMALSAQKMEQVRFLLEEKMDQYLYLEKELGPDSRSGIMSEMLAEVQELQKQVATGDRELTSLKNEKNIFENRLENQNARAPFEGVIVKRLLEPGESIQTGSSVLVVSPKVLSIELDVSETILSSLSLNQKAQVRMPAFPNKIWDGHISWISPVASEGKLKIRVQAEDLPFKPGLQAHVSLKIR